MRSVFLLQHSYEINEIEQIKIIGLYSTKKKTDEAIEKYKKIIGFRNYPDCFYVDEYELDKNHWEEGFIPWEEATKKINEEDESYI